ncbi:MAG: hypothetical protein LBP56_07530 [Odoribacteraceae bacterium]|jgi:hypothetical protein|nr:hypothetical protein [Odoribacteraceae bacterium]
MKTMDKIHGGLLRKFHALCGALGLTVDEKRAIAGGYGVESSADLDTHALIDVCAALARRLEGGGGGEMDAARKRAMAAIGGYLRKVNRASDAAIIKGIACRVTGYASFNKIPLERLRNVYHAFLNKQKDIDGAEAEATRAYLESLSRPRPGAVLN